MFRRCVFLLTGIFSAMMFFVTSAAGFVSSIPTMPLSSLTPGMTGYMLTVLKGTDPSRIPIRIEAVIPQNYPHNLILIKLLGGAKLAQGMSGSPVYVSEKLIGGLRSGWSDTDHTLGLVTPIDEMIDVADSGGNGAPGFLAYPAKGRWPVRVGGVDSSTQGEMPAIVGGVVPTSQGLPGGSQWPQYIPLTRLSLAGVSAQSGIIKSLAQNLSAVITTGEISSSSIGVGTSPFRPGDSISALLVWGDVELSALGAVTATDNHGRFIAFAHDFLRRGRAYFPSATAFIHHIVDSSSFPFKLSSTRLINGTITRDSDSGISGASGIFPSSIPVSFIFHDLDSGSKCTFHFRTVVDDFLSSILIHSICSALAQDAWDRNGQGTMTVSIGIDSKSLLHSWTRKDIFFADENIIEASFSQLKAVISSFLTQPFTDTMPVGFTITAEATQNPRILLIEDITAPSNAKPGSQIEVSVKLRPWRKSPITRKFTLTIPQDATGVVELIVRGGGTQSMPQTALDGGWKSIDSLERMLTEFRAADANNELILELNADLTGTFLENLRSKNPAPKMPDLLPEEEEYLSETKERRIREGTLKIYSTDYYVDGLMKRVIHTED